MLHPVILSDYTAALFFSQLSVIVSGNRLMTVGGGAQRLTLKVGFPTPAEVQSRVLYTTFGGRAPHNYMVGLFYF